LRIVMEARGIKFIQGKPALLSGETVAVADLHLGIEREFVAKGVRLGSLVDRLKKELAELIAEEKAKRLVIVGDVKHTIPGDEYPDTVALKAMLEELSSLAEVVIVPGNHDAGIASVAGRARVAESCGVVVGGVGFAHGHAWPGEELMRAQWLVVGHLHPCVEILEEGVRSVKPVWIVAEADPKKLLAKYPKANKGLKLVVMPAFNPLVGGIPVNRERAGTMGPLLKGGIFKFADAQNYLLDGTGLGSVSSLRRQH